MEKEALLKQVVYLTPPSSIVLISTINSSGIKNVAPFGMFMACGYDPPMVAISINIESDTHRNIIETKEFIVGIPNPLIVDQVYKAGHYYPPEVDEFEILNLTPVAAKKVRCFLIGDCYINFECNLEWYKSTGDHDIFLGKVIDVHIDESIWRENKRDLRISLQSIYHVTGASFIDASSPKLLLAKSEKS